MNLEEYLMKRLKATERQSLNLSYCKAFIRYVLVLFGVIIFLPTLIYLLLIGLTIFLFIVIILGPYAVLYTWESKRKLNDNSSYK
jgi:Flp pilus assembly protein TadB